MSERHDLGSTPNQDERTPLLGSQQPIQYIDDPSSQIVEESDSHDETEEALEDEPGSHPRTKIWWLWRILWFIVAAIAIAVFVKGWIDAGDTDVRETNERFDIPP